MYEVGDKVIYQGADKSAYKKVGVLKSIEEKDGKPQLTVEFEGGETFTAPVDDWSKVFTNAARNAKFKVGDKVWVPAKQKRGVIRGVSATGNQYDVEFMGGGGAYVNEEGLEFLQALGNTRACVSTNSVVRNAMVANRRMARNAVEVEISPGYAARAQYAMKDAARGVSGVRISGTNTLSCPDDDAADDVIEIIKMAGVPASEVWTNSRRVARNAKRLARNADKNGKCRISLKIPFSIDGKTQSTTMSYQQFIKWATENGINKNVAESMWEKANKSGGVVGGYVTASCPFSLVEE